MPRRIDRSDEEIQAALERFGGIVGFAARHLGMSPRTLSRRIDKNPDLQLTQFHMLEGITDHALGAVIRRVHAGDMKACFWWLNRFGADQGFGRHRARCEVVEPAEVARRLREFAKICPEIVGDYEDTDVSPAL